MSKLSNNVERTNRQRAVVMTDEARELEALRAGLSLAPSDLPIEGLIPVFVPSSFFTLGNWPGPYELLAVPGLGLTWSVLQPEQTMRYVDREVQAHWESAELRWRERAMQNLRDLSGAEPWTHEFRRDDGSLYAVGMMHADGTGPSRLLLRDHLEEAFPEGYRIALPEMSCGLAISASAMSPERAKIDRIVAQCFQSGTRPLVANIHDSALILGAAQ